MLGRRRLTAGLMSVPLLPLLAGCSGDDVVDLPGLPPIGPDPDEPLLEAALEAEEALLSLVVQARRRHQALRPLLRSAAEVHTAHVDLLVEATGGEPASEPDAAPDRSAPRAVLADLVRREQRLATDHAKRAMDARSGPFARVLAVLAAAATQQSVVLAQAADDLPRGRS